uniref:Uncharacterized protein n=1 Tax=Brassica oleracea TaxID=3712 RepID=A0A3P6CJ78_BRAOL|nr:unnamed protein product [Brassica oleracea]
MLDGEVGNVCIKGDASSHTPDTCAALLSGSMNCVEESVTSCIVSGLYPDLRQRDVRHVYLGWMDYRPGTRRLDGLSSWNPEAGWTIVLEPGGWLNFCPGT